MAVPYPIRSWLMQTTLQGRAFEEIINTVVDVSKNDFEEAGYDNQTLEDLKQVGPFPSSKFLPLLKRLQRSYCVAKPLINLAALSLKCILMFLSKSANDCVQE